MSKIDKSIFKPVENGYGKRPKAPFKKLPDGEAVSDEELAEHTQAFWDKIEVLKDGVKNEKCLGGLAFVATERGLGITMYGRGDALEIGFREILENRDVLSGVLIASVLKFAKENGGFGDPEDYLKEGRHD